MTVLSGAFLFTFQPNAAAVGLGLTAVIVLDASVPCYLVLPAVVDLLGQWA